MNAQQWIEKAKADYVVSIGQLDRQTVAALNRAVRDGVLVKYAGYWSTGLPHYGIGPRKTIWRGAA